MRVSKTDERHEPSVDALDAHARNLLFETLSNDRRPVAVVGSGLSVVYGGVNWEESVHRAIEFAIARIAEVDPDKRDVYLQRHRAALTAFATKGAISKSSEKYVALDLCSQALDHIDQLAGSDQPKDGDSSFRSFMANLYKDDTYSIRQLIIERLKPDDGEVGSQGYDAVSRDIWALQPDAVQRLGAIIYSLTFIEEAIGRIHDSAPRSDAERRWQTILQDLISGMREIGYECGATLPIDRRSLLCLFFASVPAAELIRLLQTAVNRARSNEPPVVPPPPHPILDPIGKLKQGLRVKRYVTLNFDYSLERRVMLDDLHTTETAPYRLETALEKGAIEADGDTGGLTRHFADGLVASSDIYHRDAVGRVFEFALDSSDYRAQILHLHGRADLPKSMLLTDSDSNRQYRRDQASRTTLEQALDVILTGHPIVFVGIGLSEAEITRALRDLVSRGHPTAFTPVFAIMGAAESGTAAWRNQVALFQQYGIHVIHAGLGDNSWAGLARYNEALRLIEEAIRHLETNASSPWLPPDSAAWSALDSLFVPARLPAILCGDRQAIREVYLAVSVAVRNGSASKPSTRALRGWKDYLEKFRAKLFTFAMIKALDDLTQGWVEYSRQRILPSEQCSDGSLRFSTDDENEQFDGTAITHHEMYRYQVREEGHWRIDKPRPLSFWRHEPMPLPTCECPSDTWLSDMQRVSRRILASDAAVVTCFSPLGSGKGRLIRELWNWSILTNQPVLIVNCNFGIEFDSALSQVLLFLKANMPLTYAHAVKKAGISDPIHERIRTLREFVKYPNKDRARKAKGRDQTWTPPVIILSGIERLIDRRGNPVAPELDLLLSSILKPAARKMALFKLVIIGADGCATYVHKKLEESLKAFADPVTATAADGSVSPVNMLNFRDEIIWLPTHDPRNTGFLGHLLHSASTALARNRTGQSRALDLELAYAASRSFEATVPNSARSRAIEAVMRVVLDHWHEFAFPSVKEDLDQGGNTRSQRTNLSINRLRARLDQHVLATLAFIGMPIEQAALDHMNTAGGLLEQIAALMGQNPPLSREFVERERKGTIGRLRSFGLVIEIAPHRLAEGGRSRVVLHRSAMAEMRERIGVRSGEELLSNSFSTTLAVSMPTDLVVPEEGTTVQLKEVVGRLRGSWRDPSLAVLSAQKEVEQTITPLRDAIHRQILVAQGRSDTDVLNKFDADALKAEAWLRNLDRALRMATTDMQVNIRAAAGVIRGFFSAASLVAQMPSKERRGDRELGEFEEHKRRLERVMGRFREAQRAILRAERNLIKVQGRFVGIADHPAYQAVERLLDLIKENKQPELPALYGAELVWLLNELGVIALLQGDLYDAQRAFREASAANGVFRNRSGGQVWRRIEINRSLLRIERGRIAEARTQLEKIEQQLAGDEVQSENERTLMKPLVDSYLGLCDSPRRAL